LVEDVEGSKAHCGEFGPGLRNAIVAHTGFDHRTQPSTEDKGRRQRVDLIGSADRLVRHELNSSKPYSRRLRSIQSFGKIGLDVG
jgi:hypothetical protein